MASVNVDYTTSNDVKYGEDVSKEFVADRFNQATYMARDAWDRAVGFLSHMGQVIIDAKLPEGDIGLGQIATAISMPDFGLLPDTPSDSQLAIPDLPVPVMGHLLDMPLAVFPQDQLDDIQLKLLAMILYKLNEGGTGLDPVVEQAIYDRANSRLELENLKQYDEAENYFASRGFSMPPGALVARIQEVNLEIVRNRTYLNNDILTNQAKLAQDNMRFLISEAGKTFIDIEKMNIDKVVETNKNTLSVYLGQLEALKVTIQVWISRIEAITKVFLAKIDAYKAKAQVVGIEIDAEVKVISTQLEKAKVQADILLKEAEINLERAKIMETLQVETTKAGAQISAQIVASALSSVNAHASIGFSAGANESMSIQEYYDMLKADKPGIVESIQHQLTT